MAWVSFTTLFLSVVPIRLQVTRRKYLPSFTIPFLPQILHHELFVCQVTTNQPSTGLFIMCALLDMCLRVDHQFALLAVLIHIPVCWEGVHVSLVLLASLVR